MGDSATQLSELYASKRKHAQLFDPERVHEWLHPRFREWRLQHRMALSGSAETFGALVRNESRETFSFPLLNDETTRMLMEEVENFHWSGLEATPPNSMNKYGLILNDIGLRPSLSALLKLYQPLAELMFPQEASERLLDHHSFVVSYRVGEDLGLDMHSDDSDVTLNVLLGDDFTGGTLTFCGDLGMPDHRQVSGTYEHVRGHGLLSLGRRRHGAADIKSGHRLSLIMWSYNWEYRNSPTYTQRMERYRRESAPPDRECLSHTHDRDWEALTGLERPDPDAAEMSWCPPISAGKSRTSLSQVSHKSRTSLAHVSHTSRTSLAQVSQALQSRQASLTQVTLKSHSSLTLKSHAHTSLSSHPFPVDSLSSMCCHVSSSDPLLLLRAEYPGFEGVAGRYWEMFPYLPSADFASATDDPSRTQATPPSSWLSRWREQVSRWRLALPASAAARLEGCGAFLTGALAVRFERWLAAAGMRARMDASSNLAAPPSAANAERCAQALEAAEGAIPDFPELPGGGGKPSLFWLPPIPGLRRLAPSDLLSQMLTTSPGSSRLEEELEEGLSFWGVGARSFGLGAVLALGTLLVFRVGGRMATTSRTSRRGQRTTLRKAARRRTALSS